jgi:capsular polysaccharide export protein
VAGARPKPPCRETVARLFSLIREARVGGRFWAPPANGAEHELIVRSRTAAEFDRLVSLWSAADREAAHWVRPTDDVDPWSLLRSGVRLFAHGDDEWTALGHIAGCTVEPLSSGRFAEEGDDIGRRIAEDLLACRYRDPFTGADSDIEAATAQLAEWRRIIGENRLVVAACGIAWWKRREVKRFFWQPGAKVRFYRSERRAVAYAARRGAAVAVWPSRMSSGMSDAARSRGVPLVRIEDGFVRSIGLGSDLVPPSSITVDRRGIHYDPAAPSDLESILACAPWPPPLLGRAARLREQVLEAGISKYGSGQDHPFPAREPGRRLVLVPGQVEDDMSVRLGGGGLASNLELLRRVRALEPDAEIWFRPHPDVDAGHRRGAIPDAEAMHHVDRVVRGGGMAPLLDRVDAVHVLTSLTGFEALLRGREVTCHGVPFYAGWGLTRDLAPVPLRRARTLTLDQLVAGVLILYPRYLDPLTGLPCPPEVLIARMASGGIPNRLGWVTRIRRLQGQIMKRLA